MVQYLEMIQYSGFTGSATMAKCNPTQLCQCEARLQGLIKCKASKHFCHMQRFQCKASSAKPMWHRKNSEKRFCFYNLSIHGFEHTDTHTIHIKYIKRNYQVMRCHHLFKIWWFQRVTKWTNPLLWFDGIYLHILGSRLVPSFWDGLGSPFANSLGI